MWQNLFTNGWSVRGAVMVTITVVLIVVWESLRAMFEHTDPDLTKESDQLEVASIRDAYFARLRDKYGRVDAVPLMPLADQDEHPPIPLREVFVPQHVRLDPPPVELSKELLRRLTEVDDPMAETLLPEMDAKMVRRLREAYEQRPLLPVLDVLSAVDRRRVVILGDPGAGKSTLARLLALSLADVTVTGPLTALSGWLPVVVELRLFADADWRERTFLDFVEHMWNTEDLGLPADHMEQALLGNGRVVMIFDGLDEVFDPQRRDVIAAQITAFTSRYSSCKVIVTSRVLGYRRQPFDSLEFSHYMLQDFDDRQVAAFVHRWYGAEYPTNAVEAGRIETRVLAAIGGSPAVRELAGNPMLLTILSIIGRRQELPRDRPKLYEHAVVVLVEQWEVNKHLVTAGLDRGAVELAPEDKLDLLRRIARRMQSAPEGLAGNAFLAPTCGRKSTPSCSVSACPPISRTAPPTQCSTSYANGISF